MEETWHFLTTQEAAEKLGVDPKQGLTKDEAARRLREYGPNELVETGSRSPLVIIWEQLTDVMVLILIAAAVVSALVKGPTDGAIIMAIVVLNATLGFVQEYRAEQAMAALKKMAAPLVRVRRGGDIKDIPSGELVPGDIVLLEAGAIIPADCRIVEAANLRVQEAALTGESEAIDKNDEILHSADHVPIGDRVNMVYRGTSVTYGRGEAMVVATGMQTELGRIARMIQAVESDPTPLQRRMGELGRTLAIAALVLVAVVFILGLLRGENAQEMFLTAVALAVAAVPEGLPAVVTISLALGAQRMLKRNALIRKLPAVETLGSVTVICSDKTGTLTENKMTVKVLDVAGETVDVIEVVREGRLMLATLEHADTLDDGVVADPSKTLLLAGGALANDAILRQKADVPTDLYAMGDPTEGALLVAAARFGMWKSTLDDSFPRTAEVPFSSERKRMTTIHQVAHEDIPGEVDDIIRKAANLMGADQAPYVAFTKGAVDSLVEISDRVWVAGEIKPLDEHYRTRVEEANAELAREGLRVLGVAFRLLDDTVPQNSGGDHVEDDLIFVGMIGMIDPPRVEVKGAVETTRSAGIRPIMITGDHPLTAQSIAAELGIETPRTLTGHDLVGMNEAQLREAVEEVSVYARVSPEHKLSIVKALQDRGHIVAMTGDGVNDAPALRKGDIGVAMGITGTDVSKEAADMVLLDDNFSTIVGAVEEGRTIYDNVRKFIKYILTSNTGEISVMVLTQLIGLPLPLTTIQILWMNLVTDGVPGLALGLEQPERNVMKRRPYDPDENIFARGMGRHILIFGLALGLISLGIGLWAFNRDPNTDVWRTMVFTTLTLSQLGHALAVRSDRESLFSIGLFTNKPLLIAIGVTLLLQMGVVYLPFAQNFFETTALSLSDLLISLAFSTIIFWLVELEKLLIRRGILKV
ncbi:MAG: cation-translocating P-type ATPase [Chloroflexi bacterium]|nr:cation-translocating P-type ATPase [Chloroflexota bacterium]